MPTLTMGHGHPPAQALAELATPGAQFIQHMAPVLVLVQQPGDPLLGNQGPMAKRPLTAAQIERRCHRHQQWAQRQCKARWLQDPVGVQLEATWPTCTRCGAKLWLPGQLNSAMQPWCVKSTCDGLPKDAQLSIEYLLSDEAMPEERGILRWVTEDSHQSEQCVVSSSEVWLGLGMQLDGLWLWNEKLRHWLYFADMVWFRWPETLQWNMLIL